MTPGPIDLKVVASRLDLVEGYLRDLRGLPVQSFDSFLSDRRNPAAAESLLRRAIESLLDTARHLLAKGFGLGSLQYREVAHLTKDKGLILDKELARTFEKIAAFRIRLTHHYEEITNQELYEILTRHLPDVEALREELRRAAARLAGAQEPP